MSIVNINIPYIPVDVSNDILFRKCRLLLRENYLNTLIQKIEDGAIKFGLNLSKELVEDMSTKILDTIILDFHKTKHDCHLVINEFSHKRKLDYSINSDLHALNFNS